MTGEQLILVLKELRGADTFNLATSQHRGAEQVRLKLSVYLFSLQLLYSLIISVRQVRDFRSLLRDFAPNRMTHCQWKMLRSSTSHATT